MSLHCFVMVAFAVRRKRFDRLMLATGLACFLPLAACGDSEASPLDSPSAAGTAPAMGVAARGLSALSPVQTHAVQPAADFSGRAVPLDPDPCDLTLVDPTLDNRVADDSTAVPPLAQATSAPVDDWIPGTGAGLTGDGTPAPLGCQPRSTATDSPSSDYALDLERRDMSHIPVVIISGVSRTPRPWFSSVGVQGGVAFRDRSWVYSNPTGPSVSMGNITANAPTWGSAAPVGGLQISNWSGSGNTLPEGQFGYSSSLGLLNRMDPTVTSGAVDYGASAGSGSLRYGVAPGMTLETQVQSARSLTARGLGTTYAAGDIGTFQAGATQSTFDAANAWRWRFGYSVDLADTVNVGFTNEQIGAGFGDLSTYSAGGAAAAQSRNTLTAGVPLGGGYGTLSGTYSGMREGKSLAEQRVGLSHSMYLAPKVRLKVGADRDVLSGDYEWRANVSMPVDTFMRGQWLPW